MAYAVLVLDVAFLAVAAVLQSILHYRRTGDSPFRSGAGITNGPFAVSGIGALVLAGPLFALAQPRDVPAAVAAVGLTLMVLGIAGTFWSQTSMGASWRIGLDPTEETALVTSGVFRTVRNPIYLAMFVFLVGQVLALSNVVSVIALVIVIAGFEYAVRAVEEPYLIEEHGDDYLGYAARVGRFIPGVGRIRTS